MTIFLYVEITKSRPYIAPRSNDVFLKSWPDGLEKDAIILQ